VNTQYSYVSELKFAVIFSQLWKKEYLNRLFKSLDSSHHETSYFHIVLELLCLSIENAWKNHSK